ncbi:Mss4-like protein [Pochonia chlamydosporia 170]|uniref:Mss4-like protein n=1 Tax=Pochonia chlamydosporia 170 TaxID=1380566 RepID=A0A179FT56_METCM|nr:Mss4-like protein [Pochonia chlamydosporia 170]OAQ68199.1 Mss4-like protein [Pochonia chlamydosporia 170]
MILPVAGRSVNVNHRRSLSNVFKTVRARYSRDKLEKNELDTSDPEVTEVAEPTSSSSEDSTSVKLERRQFSPPPQLDVLSDFSSHESTAEPSTFRAGLEKAVADINNKYGTPASTCLAEGLTDAGVSRLMNANSLPFHTRGIFRPRYQLPMFVHAPARTAQSTAGELQQLSPTASAESVSLDTKDNKEGGCQLPTLMLDKVLGPSFDLGEFMAPENATEQTSELSESGGHIATESMEVASSKNSTRTVVREVDVNSNVDVGPDLDAEEHESENAVPPVTSNQVPSPLIRITTSTENISLRSAESVHCHQRNRSNSDQPPRSPSGSNIGSFDRESLISEISSSDVRRLRSKSSPTNSESYSEIMVKHRQLSGSSRVSNSAEDNVPSVSELVSKFRQMGSVPGTFPANSLSDTSVAHPALRKISRGKQFETFRSRFSNDSEGGSSVLSNLGEAPDDLQIVVPEPGTRDPNFLSSENFEA